MYFRVWDVNKITFSIPHPHISRPMFDNIFRDHCTQDTVDSLQFFFFLNRRQVLSCIPACLLSIPVCNGNVWDRDWSLQWMCQTKIFLHHSGRKKWNLIEKVQWWQIGWEQLRGISSDESTPRLWQTLISTLSIIPFSYTWKYLWKDYHVIYGMPHPYCTTFSPGLAATHL